MKGPLPYLLLIFLIALLFHATFLLYVVYALFAALLLARLWAKRALRGIVTTRRLDDHAFLDDDIPVELELRNAGQLPVTWVLARESLPVALAGPLRVAHALSLAPGERRTLRYTLQGRRRGLYTLGPVRLSGGDLFGQEEYHGEESGGTRLTVYPRIVPLERLGLPSLSPFGHLRSRERLYADPSRVGGVRDYAAGDSVRDIHWTASASAGALQVKTYEPAMSLPTALLLDMGLAGYGRQQGPIATELGVVVAASLAAALGNARQDIALFTNGRDPLTPDEHIVGLSLGKGQAHLVRALEILARIAAVPDVQTGALLEAARARLPWGTTVIIISPEGDTEHTAALLSLRRAGFNVARVVPGARAGASSYVSLPTYYVRSPEDLNMWRQA